MKKKLLSILLVLCLLSTLLPVGALADNDVVTPEAPIEGDNAPDVPETTPTPAPTEASTETPTAAPAEVPEETPMDAPTEAPAATPTAEPTEAPSGTSTAAPTEAPEETPTAAPSEEPADSAAPTEGSDEGASPEPTASPETAEPGGETSNEAAKGLVDSGTCGENLTWTLDDGGVLTISGWGPMDDYESYNDTPWANYRAGTVHRITAVVIDSGATSIGDRAFSTCISLTKVTIPDSVTIIGESAFLEDPISSIAIPQGVITIGISAFSDTWLTSVTIPSSVIRIESGAFRSCNKLKSVSIPDSVTTIGDGAFAFCGALKSIVLPPNITSIASTTFRYSGLQTIVIPDGVTIIGTSAFTGCMELQHIEIPSSVETIENWAFSICSSLESIDLPDSITSIGEYAFEECSALKNISIPNGVAEIKRLTFKDCTALETIEISANVTSVNPGDAFSGCSSLTAINVASGNSVYTSYQGLLYTKDMKTLLYCPNGIAGEIVIPESVNSLEDEPFKHCKKITSVTIPTGVEYIRMFLFYDCVALKNVWIPDSVRSIQTRAFEGCTALERITVASDNKQYCSFDGVLFSKDMETLIFCPYGRSGAYEIPDDVSTIDYDAFSGCALLTSVTIPNSISAVEGEAFSGCTSLTSIAFTGDLPAIASSAFRSVTATVYFPIGNPTYTEDTMLNYGGTLTWETYEAPVIRKYTKSFRYRPSETEGRSWDATMDSCYYNDTFFDGPSSTYNHSLARMSLCMAVAAGNSLEETPANTHVDASKYAYGSSMPAYRLETSPAKNVAALLNNCGFSYIKVNEDYLITTDYNEELNDGNNIGVCFGVKELEDGTPLIAVVIRGSGYGDEWIGDFNVYHSGNHHIGFELAANTVLNALREYITYEDISGAVKIWITGYSRAAATANLTAAKLAEGAALGNGCTVTPTTVYAYCFETPKGTKSASAGSPYVGIWNIVNPIDVVPMVAMSYRNWNYGRYGHTLYLPSANTNHTLFSRYSSEALRLFNSYNESNYVLFPKIVFQENQLDDLIYDIAFWLGNDNTDRTWFITGLLKDHFENDDGKDTPLSTVLDIVLTAFLTQYAPIKGLVAGELETIGITHYPEMTMAWMNAIPESALSGDATIRYTIFNGLQDAFFRKRSTGSTAPVMLDVYADNRRQLSIDDGEVDYEDDAFIEAMVDEDGQMIICVPGDVAVSIDIIGMDDGVLDFSVQEYSLAEGKLTHAVNFYNVEIYEDIELAASISTASERSYVIYDDYGDAVPVSEELTGDALVKHLVTVEADGDGSVDGAGYRTRGDYARVTATPTNGSTFLGWYRGETLDSNEPVYRFRVTEDVTLTARFEGGTAVEDLTVVAGKSVTAPAENAASLSWTSSDTAIVTVNAQGRITGVKAGTATVTGSDADGPAAVYNVLVLFTDVAKESEYFYEPVYWALSGGVTSGKTPKTFEPYSSCTRGQIVTFLWRVMGSPEPLSTKNPFKDVKATDYFYKPVLWAYYEGITSGKTATTFEPYSSCTRGQAMTFLWRAAGQPEPGSVDGAFKDVKKADYFYKPVYWAKEQKITTGTTDTTFSPYRTCTRGQIVTFLYKYAKLSGRA